jgi:hypothetical protein
LDREELKRKSNPVACHSGVELSFTGAPGT